MSVANEKGTSPLIMLSPATAPARIHFLQSFQLSLMGPRSASELMAGL